MNDELVTLARPGERVLGASMTWAAEWHEVARSLREAGLFDQAWYLARYPDVAASGVEPALHYVKYGTRMGRDLGPNVPVTFWREVMPELASASDGEVLARVLAAGGSEVPGVAPHYAVRAALAWAMQREGTGRAALARRLAQAVLPLELAHASIIVDANLAARDQDRMGWARALNEYLAGQGTLPFEISSTSDNVLADITFPKAPPVETGPKVSVIMATWNAEASVAYAVRSILAQTWQPLELIVIDDASTDDTPAILRNLAARDERMIVLRNEVNAGPYVSKNIGLMAATGDYVTGHDADDLALPRRIERQVRFLQAGGHRCGFASMMRMTEDGTVTRLGNVAPHSLDGVASTAFISLMIETPLMRGIFGHWDTTRFGADSELDKRIIAVLGREVPKMYTVEQLMLDAPGGLTNDAVHGLLPGYRKSATRLAYQKSLRAWHEKIRPNSAYLPFPHEPRRFKAPSEMLNAPEVVKQVIAGHRRDRPDLLDRLIECDVCIVTTLRYPGGNCSSTLDELQFLTSNGISVRLVHCPISERLDPVRAFEHDCRYEPWADYIVDWHAINRLRCRHLIVRSPSVIVSKSLPRLLDCIECEQAHFIVNNSTHRENGQRYYDPADMVERIRRTRANVRRIVPISPLIRQQIEDRVPADLLAPENWSPTFNVADYAGPAKPTLTEPFVVGRHGRDALEKWIEDPRALRVAYPASPDFTISILGGAERAVSLLGGKLPQNWRVAEFGAIPPKGFLEALDVFAYFPHSKRYEAFGRTIVEAMIASRPVLLPPRFQTTFGELAFYGEPQGVEAMVRALAADWQGARLWLAAVQSAAIARYSSEAIAERMPDLGIDGPIGGNVGPLPADLIAFKQRIEAAGASAVRQKA